MEHIKEILVRNQQVFSQTSRTPVKYICSTCGKEYEIKISPSFLNDDGTLKDTVKAHLDNLSHECNECSELKRNERLKQESELKLKEAIKEQKNKWEQASNLPSYFREKRFDDFDKSLQPKAYQAVTSLQWQETEESQPKSLVLLSPGIYGVGKTHLVCALINHIISTEDKASLNNDYQIRKRNCPVYFISENELLRRIRNTYNRNPKHDEWENDGETEEDIYNTLKRFDLLVIDDTGKVRPRDSNFLQGVYFNILDQRYNDFQSLILTTNLGLAELEEHIGGACADRLVEMCGKNGFIKMSGKSHRHQ